MQSNSNITNKLSILISTCDGYHDVLKIFFAAFREYWTILDLKIHLSSQKTPYIEDGLIVTNHYSKDPTESDEWGYRLIKALNSIETEFVIFLLDDYILEEIVKSEAILQIIDTMELDAKIACFYLTNVGFNPIFQSEDKTYQIGLNHPYRINTAPAIWRRKLLISMIEATDNPWAWEVFAMYRAPAKLYKFLSFPQSFPNIYKYAFHKGGGIYRGKWNADVVLPKIRKYKLDIDPSIRGILSTKDMVPRTLRWKILFIKHGWRMVGIKIFGFIFFYIKNKLDIK